MSSSYSQNIKNENQYQIRFMPDKNEQEITSGNIKATIKMLNVLENTNDSVK